MYNKFKILHRMERKINMRAVDRFYEKRWGVFTHYLSGIYGCTTSEEWNACVNSFDVHQLAKTLHEMGAGYYFITIMQGTRFLLAPNATYDSLFGAKPGEICAERDLVLDLYEALEPYGIDLYLYYTGDGPHLERQYGEKMGIQYEKQTCNGELLTDEFVRKWADVLREYSIRYGSKVKGWWLDGMYNYFGYHNEKMALYYDAVKAGNPDAITAFNNGTGEAAISKWYEKEEFLCGEALDFETIPKSRFVDGAQSHMLAPLGIENAGDWAGARWAKPGARRDHAYMKDFIDRYHAAGGVVTVDIRIESDGRLDPAQIAALTGI